MIELHLLPLKPDAPPAFLRQCTACGQILFPGDATVTLVDMNAGRTVASFCNIDEYNEFCGKERQCL